ncbi:MAG: SecDF P1 head subdomain-containing protein [Bacteroidia bacterium]
MTSCIFTLLCFLFFSSCTPQGKGKHTFLLQTDSKQALTPTEFADYQTKLYNRLASFDFEKSDISITQADAYMRIEIAQWSTYEQMLKGKETDLNAVRSIIQTTGKISIWNTYTVKELIPSFIFPDTMPAEKRISFLYRIGSPLEIGSDFSKNKAEINSPLFARTNITDTANIRALCDSLLKTGNFPTDLRLIWTVRPDRSSMNYFQYIAVKANIENQAAFYPKPASVLPTGFARNGFGHTIKIKLNEQDKQRWQKLTREAINQNIAIQIDQHIYMWAQVNSEIKTGEIEINGFGNSRETLNMKVCLSNPFANRIRIVEEQSEN